MLPVPVKALWDTLRLTCKVQTADDLVAMKNMVNLAYYELASMRPWRSLRRKVTITLTAGDTTGGLFPADMAGIYAVVDTEGNPYQERDITNIRDDDNTYRWYISDIIDAGDNLLAGKGVGATPGKTTINGITFTAAHVGEYIQIGGNMGLYLIKSQTGSAAVIEPAFRGWDVASDEVYVIRPEGQLKVMAIDTDSAMVTAGVYYYYWAFPPILTEDQHLIQLPSTRALELMAAARYWGDYKQNTDERDRFNGDINKALSGMKSAEPMQLTQAVYKDAIGRRAYFGRRR